MRCIDCLKTMKKLYEIEMVNKENTKKTIERKFICTCGVWIINRDKLSRKYHEKGINLHE